MRRLDLELQVFLDITVNGMLEYLPLDARDELDQTLLRIRGLLTRGLYPKVSISYFLPDSKKEGGSYVISEGRLAKIDEYSATLFMEDRTVISFDDILSIEIDKSD